MRVHLIDSEEPIQSGKTIRANCGMDIVHAEFAFMFDLNLGPDPEVSAFVRCYDCRKTRLAKRYVYGIVHGQESKTA